MKSYNYDSKLSMILALANKSGMILNSIGRELGASSSSISEWMSGRHAPKSPDKVLNTVKKRATFLSHVDLEKHTLPYVHKISGVSYTSLAEEMGISPQALDQFMDSDWEGRAGQARKKEAQEVLRGIGRRILKGMA